MSNYRTPKKTTKKRQKQQKKVPSGFFSFIKYFFIVSVAICLAGYIAVTKYLESMPPIKNLANLKPNMVTQIYSVDGEIIKTFKGFKSVNAEFKDIPDAIKQGVIATEDKKFYSHKGYDTIGLARSVLSNVMAGKVVQGASTITQQLARTLFLSNEKTYIRKIKELIISARIEKSVSKDKILEMYLNNVYLGSSAYGVAAAAEVYFGKKLNQLTLAECALIAGLPQAPSVYSPFNKPDLAIKRRNHVLNRMYKENYISLEQLNQAKEEKLKLNPNPDINVFHRAGYFVDYVIDELELLGFTEQEISQGGYKITTTLNYKAQKAAEAAILKNLKAWGLTQDKQQAAVFSFNPNNGKIYVYIGGKNYSKSQYDRVRFALRPPGSAFKPFVYAAAIETGHDPNEMIVDEPIISKEENPWAPKNYGDKYRGKIPLYYGLTISSNVVAVKLMEEVGIKPVINTCRALGITTPIQYDYTVALGSNGIKLYELVMAYGAFANDGFKVRPYAVEQIETSRGKVIYKAPKRQSLKVLDSRTAAILTAMLETVVKEGTGRQANIGKPAAAKTGTTDNYKDAWFVGYTPNVATGVWVGNDDNSNMKMPLTGGTVPAVIWRDVMKIVTEPYGNVDFTYPDIELKKPTEYQSAISNILDGLIRKENATVIDEQSNELENQDSSKAPVPRFVLFKKEAEKEVNKTSTEAPLPNVPIPAVKEN